MFFLPILKFQHPIYLLVVLQEYLYSNQTLKALIEKAGLRIDFIQQIQRYPLANHLYWLSHNKPGGHQEWGMLTDYELDKAYGDKLAKLGIADTIIAVVKK